MIKDGFALQLIGQNYWGCVCCACALGLALSFALYRRGEALSTTGGVCNSRRCAVRSIGRSSGSDDYSRAMAAAALAPNTTSQPCPEFLSRSAAAHFYCGYEWNPTFFNGLVDGKMFL